ncbi:T9SS type A sorting domain-containing protein [Xanthomarina sp. F1114]|uniref:T9SS type A sorting domain-containing protein n=1 Tax=Xanthomarina sp. F1114 TaxID=2996019 RepID=UPI00225DDF39|nr:T9SS type A sorting domain-containing protein [Xanthomarina sp. F1114]MCX7547248.1 T9SS type A sorting domain-containing protein [Xanthomarina sp. F1114]
MNNNFTPNLKYVTPSILLVFIFFISAIFNTNAQTVIEAINTQKGTEIPAKRSQFSKHFINEDGTSTAIVTAGNSLNYTNTENKWQTIDNNIIASNTQKFPNHPWENTKNRFHSYYPNDVSQGIITTYTEGTVKEGLNKRMVWLDVNFNTISEFNMAHSTANVRNNTVEFSDVFSGIDLIYTQLNDGRKMDYVLRHADITENLSPDVHYLAFAEDIELPEGATLVPEKNQSGISNINILLKGELVFRYDLPKHYDSDNKEVFSNYIVRNNTIYTLVEKSWLVSGLNYPVFIDPTVTVYPTGNGDYVTGCIDNEGTANKTAPADIYAGMRFAYGQETGTRRFFRAWASFDVSTIPDGSTVDNVVFGCYIGLNSLYQPEGQYIRVGPIVSGIPNQETGPTLYNMCGENPSDAFFSVNPGVTSTDASLDLTSIAPSYIESSLFSGIFSLSFAPEGNYTLDATEQIGIYGSPRLEQTSNGKPYLIITYTDDTIGVSDFDLHDVGVYPNPTQSELIITSKEQVSVIEIYSVLGQLVLSETDKSKVDVATLSNGTYILKVTLATGKTLNKKIIKN